MLGVTVPGRNRMGSAGMAKDKKPVRQINYRCDESLYERLARVADALGLDLSNFTRMVLMEHLHQYEERVESISPRKPKRSEN